MAKFTYHKGDKTPWTLTGSEKHRVMKKFKSLLDKNVLHWYDKLGYIRSVAEDKFLDYGIRRRWKLPLAKNETIEKVKVWLTDLNKPKTIYFGQYEGAGKRFITRIKLTTGETINTMIPIDGDYGFIDGRWVALLGSLTHGPIPLDLVATIESLHYEGIRYRFMNPNDGWDYDNPIPVEGKVSIGDFFVHH